jgi:hypothetical protein
MLFIFQYLILDFWSRVNICEHGLRNICWKFLFVLSWLTANYFEIPLLMLLQSTRWLTHHKLPLRPPEPSGPQRETTDIGKSQQLRKEDNARFNNMSAMIPGLAMMIEKVHISTYFDSAETDLNRAENVCCIDYIDTCSSKWVHWMPKIQGQDCSATYYRCEDKVELDLEVAQAHQLITWSHMRVA